MKISGQRNLTNLQDLKTTSKTKEEPLFADNDKVTLSGSSDAGDVSFLKVFKFKGPSYTKEQALFDLTDAEDSGEQAMDDLRIIEGNMKKNETLKEATDQFIRILHYWGTDHTTEAQQYFTNIGNTLRQNETRKDAVDLYLALSRAEDDLSQGMSDYLFINGYVDDKKTRKEMTDQFVNLLKFVGLNNTDKAKSYFSNIERYLRPDEKRQDALELYKELAKAEDDMSQGMSDYLFINGYVDDKKTRKEMTEQFVNLLKFVGKKNTEKGKTYFSYIERCLRPDEKRQDSLELYKALARAEDDLLEGMSNYLIINNYVTKEKTREELTAQFIRILERVGMGNTIEARKMFTQLNS